MAAPAPPNLALTGPAQVGGGVAGLYVYWITMPDPKPETVAQTQVKTPAESSHDSFRELLGTLQGIRSRMPELRERTSLLAIWSSVDRTLLRVPSWVAILTTVSSPDAGL